MPHRRTNPRFIVAVSVIGAAILLTAYKGNTDWLAMTIFLAVLLPGWSRRLDRILDRKPPDACKPPEPGQ